MGACVHKPFLLIALPGTLGHVHSCTRVPGECLAAGFEAILNYCLSFFVYWIEMQPYIKDKLYWCVI